MANLSIKSKLLTMLLAVSLFSIATVASLNYYATYKALEASALSHLTSLRAARADQLEQLVERLRDETRMVAGNASIVEASRDFISAYRALENVTIDPSMDLALHQYYQQSFLPEYEKETGQVPELDPMLPATPAARYLQYQWMAHNPFPIAEKDKLVRADDDSAYSRAHEKWHPVITRLFDSLGFKGIVIVDIETGAIVYTRRKLPDFATRLSDGPWAHTHAAELFRRIQRAPERTTVDIEDFELFRPYFDEPSSFFATPIFDGGRAIAVLMLRLSTERIDQVMTGGHQWERDGLGKTGEAYVVGHDFRMRSNSRFLIEAPEQYAQALQQTGMPERDIAEIMREKSTILLQKVRSTAAQEALAGNEGTGPVVDYRGVDILGSWAPLHIAGLDWGIVAKINSDEAYAPMRKMARNTLIQTLLILLLITLVVMFLATSFVRPVNELIARVKLARSGNTDMAFAAESTDEIGDLARSFRELIDSVRKQTNLLEQVTTEHQQLLESVMPKGMAQRVKVSHGDITEQIEDVSIVFAELRGLADYTQATSDNESVAVLKRLIAAFDEVALRHGVERIKTVGDTYLAVTGLSQPLLDHMRRTVEFALTARTIVMDLNREKNSHLGLTVGIASGPVVADVMGQGQFQLWGAAVIAADHAMDSGAINDVVVTRSVRDGLVDQYTFEPLQTSTSGVPMWTLAERV